MVKLVVTTELVYALPNLCLCRTVELFCTSQCFMRDHLSDDLSIILTTPNLFPKLLETGDHSWQPQDYLPDLSKEGWLEEVEELRGMHAELPDDLLVVLIGDMVTEEALPTYQTLLNTFEGCDDPTGTTESAWARWSRGWTSEENRHGDLLNKYLYLGGRTDMRSIEVTIQNQDY